MRDGGGKPKGGEREGEGRRRTRELRERQEKVIVSGDEMRTERVQRQRGGEGAHAADNAYILHQSQAKLRVLKGK